MKLAFGITTVFYGEEAAGAAQDQFVNTFQKGNIPEEMPEYQLKEGDNLIDILVSQKMASSRGEARRLLEQQGIKLDGETVSDANVALNPGEVLQVGKRRFLRLT